MPRARLLAIFLLGTLLVALAGCAGSAARLDTQPPPGFPPQGNPAPDASADAPPPPGFPPTDPLERARLQKNFARVLPPQAYAALERLGLPAASTRLQSSRRQASYLPNAMYPTQSYGENWGFGKIGQSPDAGVLDLSLFLDPPAENPFSYALYRLDDLVEPLGGLGITIGASEPGVQLGVAAYNWAYGSLGRWEPLYYGPAEPGKVMVDCTAPPSADYRNANGDMAFVCFVTQPLLVRLDRFDFTTASAFEPPLAALSATPGSGAVPHTVLFDASTSSDRDGAIVKYRFDPLGDGNWIDNGNLAYRGHTYTQPGAYQARLEVTDNEGDTDVDFTTVVVTPGSYDEVEDNDTEATAQQLPAVPFSDWYGNIGTGGAHDGDVEDVYKFDVQPGDELRVLVQYSPGAPETGYLKLSLLDAAGRTLEVVSSYDPYPINYTVQPEDAAPLTLRLGAFADLQSDYMLSIGDVVYDEYEHNDDVLMANWLSDLQTKHQLSGFHGNVGVGDFPLYDGDDRDHFFFRSIANAEIDLTLSYDPSQGSVGIMLLTYGGELLGLSGGGDGSEQIAVTLPADHDHSEALILRVVLMEGAASYELAGSIFIPNPGYDESEDNDSEAQANPLPTIPFSGFTGNLGSRYDDDSNDYFTFDGEVGEVLRFVITPDPAGNGSPTVLFRDAGGETINQYVSFDPVTRVQVHDVFVRSWFAAPYYIRVAGAAVDYSIEAFPRPWDEVEDNDDEASATLLTPDSAYYGIYGEIGSGGSNDGDSSDFFSFSTETGTTPYLFISWEQTLGNLGLAVRDSQGDEVGQIQLNDGYATWWTVEPLDSGDVSPFYLEVSALSGLTAYRLGGNI